MKIFSKKNNIRKSAGFMVVEVLIATSIIAASVLAATAVAQKSINVSRQALHSLQASFLLEEGAEVMRILRDNSWSTFVDANYGTPYGLVFSSSQWTLSGSSSTTGIFTRRITFYTVERDAVTGDIISTGGLSNTDTVLLVIEVTWNEGGQSITKNLSLYLNDI